MASASEVDLNEPHPPRKNAIEAFNNVLHTIKSAIVKSRRDWNKHEGEHERKMWSRADGLSDDQLRGFTIEEDLVQVRSGSVSYGTIIFGKIRIPAVNDELGEGYIHVRIHDPPNKGDEDVMFHSILTVWGEGHPHAPHAIQTKDYPLEFFND